MAIQRMKCNGDDSGFGRDLDLRGREALHCTAPKSPPAASRE